MLQYTARSAGDEVSIGTIYSVAMAGWTVNEDGSGHTMGFQSMLEEPEPSDVELGLESYCVSAERGAPVYGGVREVRLQDAVIRVVLDPEVAADFGLDDPVVEVLLAVDDEAIEQLRVGLRRILNYGRESSRPAVEL